MAWESTHKCLQGWYIVYASNYYARKSPLQQSSPEYVRRLFLYTMKIENSNAFQWKKIVLCQQHTAPLHTLLISSFFFIYLPIKAHVKYQRRSLLNQQNAANQGLFYSLTVPINNNTYFEKRNALFSKEIFQNTCKSRRV